jgi:hypothetical protein
MITMPKAVLVIFLSYFLFIPLPSLSQSEAMDDSTESPYQSVPAKSGELCTVCGVPLTEDDVALIVKGRRVPLNKAMVNKFLQNQEKYFATMQPRSALFQAELDAPAGTALGGVSSGWFLFGLYVLVALIFGGMSGYTAVAKGLKPIPHFFIGFAFCAIGYLYVLTRPRQAEEGEIPSGLVKVPATSAPTPCKKCGYTNHPSAKKCAGCGTNLTPIVQSDVTRVR